MPQSHAILATRYHNAESTWVVEADPDERLEVVEGTAITEALDLLAAHGWVVVSSFSPGPVSAVFVFSHSS